MPTTPSMPSSNKRPARAAGVWRIGSQLRVVVCRTGKPGEPGVVIESFRTLDAPTKTVVTRNMKALAEVMVGVLPGASATWRRVDPLPDDAGTPETIAGALCLLAEVHAPGVAPHRRAAGVIKFGPDVPPITGIASWVQDLAPVVAALDAVGEITHYTPAPVALALAMRLTGRTRGVCVLAEPGDSTTGIGTVSIVSVGPQGSAIRVARDESSDPEAWLNAITQRAGDAAEASGVAAPVITPEAMTHAVVFPAQRFGDALVGNLPSAPRWLEEYAPAFGAAVGAILAAPAERPLLEMTFDPPGTSGGVVERIVTTLAKPRVAITLGAVCLLLLLALPMAAAYARLTMVTARAAGADTARAPVLDAARQADLYAITLSRRWPMSKLLAELAGIAPKGINIESVSIEVGRPIQIVGTADTPETLASWREKLVAAGVFDDAKANQSSVGGQGIRFELTARVAQATMAMNSDAMALAKASQAAAGNATTTDGTAAPSRPSNGARTDRGNNGRATRPSPSTGGTRETPTPRAGNTPTPEVKPLANVTVPPPLSSDQIAKLDRPTAMREFAERKRASSAPGLDETTRQRLKDESQACRERMQALSGSAS